MRNASLLRSFDAARPRATRGSRRPRARLGGLAVTAALLAQACVSAPGDDKMADSAADEAADSSLEGVNEARPTYTAAFLAEPPTVDGALGEYDALASIRLASADGATLVRAGWTADALYVAFDVDDLTLLPASGARSRSGTATGWR